MLVRVTYDLCEQLREKYIDAPLRLCSHWEQLLSFNIDLFSEGAWYAEMQNRKLQKLIQLF